MPISISLANVLCSVFVDGGYVREEMKRQQLPYEFDPREPGRWLSAQKIVIGARIVVPDRTHYYDGIDDSPVTPEAIAPNKRLASEGLIAVHSEQPTPEQGIRDVKHPRPRR
jgi:hypothetical protein